ncbi:hypothetical protein KUTeg_004912 [Tegillarca granosa]|uniref:S1 motif domain-containing protein n=1 Tax=Tegillarca granosa TaxID=220873 RepID=A0ABQ9FMS0_TEGGR|nr:hypothetical protein KUTeg_004912 [Tegillarca granosa]
MTHRLSLIEMAKENELVSDFDQIQPGMMVPGSVKNLMDYGIFVEFPGGLFGLAPNKYATDVKVPDLKKLYHPGQSVIAKVIEVDKEKKRFLISLRMADCYHGDTDIGLGLLEDNLKYMDYVIENMAKRKGTKKKLSQMQVGNICISEVTEVNSNGALCMVENRLKGLVTKSHMEGMEVAVGQKLESVILYIDPKNDCLELSFDKTLIKAIKHRKENTASMVKEGQVLKSEILLVKEHLVLVVLKGHGAGKLAYIPSKRHLNDVLEMHQYFEKQVNKVALKHQCGNHQLACLQIHEDRKQKEIELEQAAERKLASKETHNFKCGMTVKAVVRHVYPHQINISLNGFPGRIHVTEIVDNIKNGKKPCQAYKASMEIDVRIIGFRDAKSHSLLPISHPGVTRSLPECTVKPSKMSLVEIKEEKRVFHPGDKILAFVHNYVNNCLWMHVTPSVSGRVYFLNLSNNFRAIENPSHFFKPGQGYHATVLNVEENGSLELSLIDEREKVEKNGITKGVIVGMSQESGLTVQLVEGYKGIVGLTDISDSYTDNPTSRYHKGQCVRCYVLSADSDNKEKCALSLRKSRLTTEGSVTDLDIQSISNLTEGQILRGFVTKRKKSGLIISIGNNISGKVNTNKIPHHLVYRTYPVGKVATVKILSIQNTDISLELLKDNDSEPLVKVSNKKLAENRKRLVSETSVDETGVSSKKKKRQSVDKKSDVVSMVTGNSDTDSGVEVKEDADSDIETQVVTSTTEVPRLKISAGFSWDTDFQMPVDDQSHHDNASSDESENDEEEKSTKINIGKKKRKLEEEKKLFELEKLRLEGDSLPESSEDFDRLVLQSPDSSIVWLRYMAHHLEMAEIEKARIVAERALKTISYREEQEKLNVWVAYLNLENMYGSQESLKAVLDRAVQQNEPTKVYNQMINIYVASGKIQEAEQLYNIMVRKYSMQKDTWTGFGLFYFKNNRIESARNLLQRSLKSLNKKDHVEVIAKFAQMEYKYGEPERGKTMFENILSNYPKRSDLWSVYIDMSTKAGDTDSTRQLYERIINLKMSAKKMKFFFKKYLDFEKAHGSSEQVENVMQKAMEYVESRGYVDE